MLEDFLQEAINVLKKTPDMLPVLKKADVVDSGGAGLVCIIEGALQALEGKEIETEMKPKESDNQELNLDLFTEDSVLEYGYCTELLLRLQRSKTDPESLEVSTLTEYLKGIGDSVVAFKTGSIVKIHIHTMTPDRVLAFCQRYGEFLKIKIENMSLQHNNITVETKDSTVKDLSKRKKYGLVAVASGVGVKQLFYDGGDGYAGCAYCRNITKRARCTGRESRRVHWFYWKEIYVVDGMQEIYDYIMILE